MIKDVLMWRSNALKEYGVSRYAYIFAMADVLLVVVKISAAPSH